MPRSKSYLAVKPCQDNLEEPPSPTVDFVALAPQARHGSVRTLSFGEWLGKGIDEWVWATVKVLTSRTRAGRFQISSINAAGKAMTRFFAFLVEERRLPLVARPADIKPIHTAAFVGRLKEMCERERLSAETVRGWRNGVKSVVLELLAESGTGVDPNIFFPPKALPNGNSSKSTEPYSDEEQRRLASALKADLRDIHHGRLALTGSEVMTVYYLIVAMRSGGNLTPLLEMRRDALGPGLLPGVMALTTHKFRGKKVGKRAAGHGTSAEPEMSPIPTDAAAVVARALRDSESLVADAPVSLANRVWLFRSSAQSDRGRVQCLNDDNIRYNVRRLVVRRGVLADDGTSMVVTTRRLRASLAHRIWRLSDGDVVAVASILGNTPSVADSNYLAIDDELKAEAATLMGGQFTVQLRDGRLPVARSTRDQRSGKDLSPTPVARCSDTLQGELAPKDGTKHCDQFVHCISCSSFAVVGELDDLWRLFSFRRFAELEVAALKGIFWNEATRPKWANSLLDRYGAALTQIEPFSVQMFGPAITKRAMFKAATELHPFWAARSKQSALRRSTS